MSSRTVPTQKINACGEIDLTPEFSQHMSQLCMSSEYSDVAFIVEGVKLPAHKILLAARSSYFRALLYGGLCETNQNEIELKVPLEAFKALLEYIYTGCMSLAKMKEENILDSLGLANQYGFETLELAISTYLTNSLSLKNCCAILDAARLYNLDTLSDFTLTFMDRNSTDLLNASTFKTLSQDSLCTLLQRDSFFAPEVNIFNAVYDWCKNNPNADIETVVSFVRLPLMNLKQLLRVVRPCAILDPDRLLDAIEEQTTSKNLVYRGALWPEENVASAKFNSKTIRGELRSALLDGDVTNYDMEKGYTRHSINDANDLSIIVELGTISIINHMKMLLWDRDTRSYSYYIETSVDQNNWHRVVDHTKYMCRSWQFLYFPSRAVRFIKLVGTHNTCNKVFHVVALEAYYTMRMPTLVNGLVLPTYNVATVEMSSMVIEGVSRTRNALLNGDVKNYDWDSGYTCHQLGSGVIVVQLGQPYYIGSMRLLLWDCDSRTYSFFIETSVNQKDWEMAVDKKDEQLRSWQQFIFEPRPVVFIKIVGTYNTANEIFHCVHFECPADLPKQTIEAQIASALASASKSSSSSHAKSNSSSLEPLNIDSE
ncbi:BTB/POZ domain-containing protein 9 [Contarinia nasturtii]|uniref:BTB/POZ domain-containing protein 9 n=1 Tax=Contarinia nasturtii TaxID=265458 RepID=UPI0012D46313|nr:BTB/POZ domain-containing protein 9 [Contarinia nasturtii]